MHCRIALLFACLLPLTVRADWFAEEASKMGTRMEVRLWHDDELAARRLISSAMAEFDRIEAGMSTYREDSEISRLNARAASGPVPVSADLFDIVTRSIELSEFSGGAFDITYESVGQLYDFRRRQRPSEAEIAAHLPQISYRHLRLDPVARTIAYDTPGTRINLGGIAKGWAVERVIAQLRAAGVRHALATAGGDTRLLGDRRGEPWVVGVRDPDDAARLITRLALDDEAISTSGDYERFFDEGGERYHHILDPKTGRSAHGVRSVTIVGPDAVMTEGLTKTVFIQGAARGLAVVESLPGYDAVIVDSDKRVFLSKGLQAQR
ncbi:MAG: FAD:protein FMN transferase [Gammaproteobacteria bacterium]|nr:FAD:protein FMN transferase [Gammaproteobacteria bacterium]